MKSAVNHLLAFGLIFSLSGCEVIDLINTVGTVLKPSASATPSAVATAIPTGPQAQSPVPTAPPVPTSRLEVVRSGDPSPVSVDWNLARQPGTELMVSSTLNPTYDKARLLDGKLSTSWFTADHDVPAKGKLPTIELGFAQPVGVISVNLRGDRERSQGMQIEELSVLLTSAQGILLNETVQIPTDAQDVNLVLRQPVNAATSLRLTVTRSKNGAVPGLAEIEVLGRR